MTKFLLVLFIFIFCLQTISQTKDEAFRDAKKTTKAAVESDFETVLKNTNF